MHKRRNGSHLALADLLTEKPRALLVSEVAEVLNISERLVYRMAKDGIIPSIRIAGCIRFDPLALARWLRANGRGAL
jgi:excisionase family DNA binding protein